MRLAAGLACVGIKGGETEAVKEFLKNKSPRALIILRLIVVVAAGNNLAKKQGNKQVPKETATQTRESLQSLVRFIQIRAPNAIVVTTDLIPRSTSGFFNSRARVIARNMVAQSPTHHHAEFLNSFLIISRVKASETYRPKDLFYQGGDGVHPNVVGYEALTMITNWLLEKERPLGDEYHLTIRGHSLTVKMKF